MLGHEGRQGAFRRSSRRRNPRNRDRDAPRTHKPGHRHASGLQHFGTGQGRPSSWALLANFELCCPGLSWLAPSGRWARARPAGGASLIRQASPSRPGRAIPRFGWILLGLGGKARPATRRCGHRAGGGPPPPPIRGIRIERSSQGHRPAAPRRNPNPCRARTRHRFARRAPRSIGGRSAAPVRSPRPGW